MLRSRVTEFVLVLACSLPLMAQQSNGGRPGDATQDVYLSAGDPGACAFPVKISITGKQKALNLPGGRTIYIGPGQHATITNELDQSKVVTIDISGSWHVTALNDGDAVYHITGNSLLWGGTLPTLTYTSGSFTFALDGDNKEIAPLQGDGRRLDVCAAIE